MHSQLRKTWLVELFKQYSKPRYPVLISILAVLTRHSSMIRKWQVNHADMVDAFLYANELHTDVFPRLAKYIDDFYHDKETRL